MKLNGFENYLITESLLKYRDQVEKEISKPCKRTGGTSIIAPGYYTMIIKDLINKVDDLTEKKYIKNRKANEDK